LDFDEFSLVKHILVLDGLIKSFNSLVKFGDPSVPSTHFEERTGHHSHIEIIVISFLWFQSINKSLNVLAIFYAIFETTDFEPSRSTVEASH
jgi:hypothetical protein